MYRPKKRLETIEECDHEVDIINRQIKKHKEQYEKMMFSPEKDQEEVSRLLQEIATLSQRKDLINIQKNRLALDAAAQGVDTLCEGINKLNQKTAKRSSVFAQPSKEQIEEWNKEKEGLIKQLAPALVKIQVLYRTLLPSLEKGDQEKLRNGMHKFQKTFLSPPSSSAAETDREKTRYQVMQSLKKGKPSSTGEAALNAASTLTSEGPLRRKPPRSGVELR